MVAPTNHQLNPSHGRKANAQKITKTEAPTLATPLLLAVVGDAGVEGDTPYPGVHLRLAPETVEAFPEVDEDFLEQVVDLVGVLGEHVADRIDGAFVLSDHSFKIRFFLRHWF